MKQSIRSLFLIPIFMICTQTYANTFLSDAEKYAVRVKSSISYPFAEDEAGTFNGAGFLIDRERGWFLTNAHVSDLGSGIGAITQLSVWQARIFICVCREITHPNINGHK